MSIRRTIHSLPLWMTLLGIARLLVPGDRREEWFAEWKSELWHISQGCLADGAIHGRGGREAEITAFCLGAFKDAFWMWRESSRSLSGGMIAAGYPRRCQCVLAAIAAASLLLALYLPSVRKVAEPSPYRDARNLVTISAQGHADSRFPSVQFGDYQDWSRKTDPLFSALAFYQPLRRRVHTGKHLYTELSIARASDRLPELLGLPLEALSGSALDSNRLPRIVLSSKTWRNSFHSDPGIFGHLLNVAGQQGVVTCVMADDDWRLPGRFDLWLFEDERRLAALPSHTAGFVIARVVPLAFPNSQRGYRRMQVFRGSRGYDPFDCVSLAEQSRQPAFIFLFTLFLACLALPATTSLPLGEYPCNQEPQPWQATARRWAFLSSKFAWIAGIVYFGSLDVAYFSPDWSLAASEYIQLATSFFAFLFAFRWALRDQRKRCPVCLRSLTNPARVGESSRNFLAWNGTELVCLGGHGLLHVPDIPTSWFSTQRWLYLDSSWSSLFSAGYLASPGTF